MQIYDFSKKLSQLNKEGNYHESIRFFEQNYSCFTENAILSNDYIISAMLTAFRKTEHIDDGFRFLEKYKITIVEKTSDIVLNSYGWLLYSKFKSENAQHLQNHHESDMLDEDDIFNTTDHCNCKASGVLEQIEEYLPLIQMKSDDFSYSVFSNLFTIVLKTEKSKSAPNWSLINNLCDLVAPDNLRTDCKTIEVSHKGNKKPMELASDKENWFAFKSNALIRLGQFDECHKISKLALESFDKFHYSNDAWFARRIALSKKHAGNTMDAINDLLLVLKRKKEWFIQKEIAELYKECGQTDDAFEYAIQAINNFGGLGYKIDLLFMIGELFKIKGENELSFKHFSLSRLIRISEE